MISEFLHKLEFVHQFNISKGDVELLGVKEFFLPVEVLDVINSPGKDMYKKLKDIFKRTFEVFLRKIGSSTPLQKYNNVLDLLNTMGIGDVEVDFIDSGKKRALIKVFHSPIVELYIRQGKKSSAPVCHVIKAVLAGAFTSFFNKPVECEETRCAITGSEYCQFAIK